MLRWLRSRRAALSRRRRLLPGRWSSVPLRRACTSCSCVAWPRTVTSARRGITSCRASCCFAASWAVHPTRAWRRAATLVGEPDVLGDRAAAYGQLQAGIAAIDAGAVEPGMACLRMACAQARACGDADVLARVLLELGSALVHAVRGRDEEGAAILHEALSVAESTGAEPVMIEACRELGYIEVQAGRPATAGRWLSRASAHVTGGPRARESAGRPGDGVVGSRALRSGDRAARMNRSRSPKSLGIAVSRPGRWRSSGGRCCCEGSCRRLLTRWIARLS